MNPIRIFETWFEQEKKQNHSKLQAACCLSTIGLDGFPNSRFVSLKAITNDSFVITGTLDSRKGIEISNCSKASLTFWWSITERQIRIQGNVIQIPKSEADIYFEQRHRDSKIVSSAFEQGKEIQSFAHLQNKFKKHKDELSDQKIERPSKWGGIYINPLRIELMEFRQSRLHERRIFTIENEEWEMKIIQP